MARFIPGVTAPVSATRHADPLTDLTRLLSRLQQTILRADAEREARLRTSEFEREKAKTNVNYARSLLSNIEQEALGVKIHVRRQELQADLNRKRELLEQITERISDLAEMASYDDDDDDQAEDGSDNTSEGDDDILSQIIATPSESLESTKSSPADPIPLLPDNTAAGEDQIPLDMAGTASPPATHGQIGAANGSGGGHTHPTITTSTTTSSENSAIQTETSQTLRARGGAGGASHQRAKEAEIAQSTGTSTGAGAGAGAALFGSNAAPTTALATTEAILDHQRAEQDILSESMLKLAADLKASSQALSNSLDEDKELVSRAGEGMSKTGEGMDAVTRRMGALTRMTEGEGWWGRMRLYAMIYGLMVVLVLVVFVLPKLRF
ncbi:hypothetical protein B0H66DRAFT_594642 [Apodospora peruviana]|uniref:Synaptobrevin n=1 Tax=Apodospora peruviana TaxID=516989 RepID=A0AAE0HVR6_9PEZI|nr:hypothetical protein B0H66DRAFT_594642 [Apodospora peruviana]